MIVFIELYPRLIQKKKRFIGILIAVRHCVMSPSIAFSQVNLVGLPDLVYVNLGCLFPKEFSHSFPEWISENQLF